jgi:DNA-binding NarL/FixJ family response regulator
MASALMTGRLVAGGTAMRTESQGGLDTPVRILIVDAEPIVREGLHALIAREPDLVPCGQAASCREALKLVHATRPDLIIVASSLSDGSGLRMIKRSKAGNAAVRFLVVSHHAEDVFAGRALRAGAHGFIGMHEPTEKIIEAIRRVREGKLYLSEYITQQLLQGLVAGTAGGSPLELLTNRELQVFDLDRQGLSTSDIAAHLHVSCKTVVTHRRRIQIKLGDPAR